MELNYFDLVVAVIVLLLGLKGLFNGFFKELFGLIGIIGGVFVASRVGESVGQFLSDAVLKLESSSAISFLGFLVTLALFWLLMVGVGYLFKKLSSLSGLGGLDRVFGFILGSGKFFLIAAIIAYALNNITAVRSMIEEPLKNSIAFPILVKTGGYIMKIDRDTLNATLDKQETQNTRPGIEINRTDANISE